MVRITLLAIALVGTTGCARQIANAAINECATYGYQQGTPEFAECAQRSYNARVQNFQNAAQNFSAQRQAMGPANGILKGSYVSGANRVCVYNDAGSERVVTVGAADLCP